MSKRMFSDHIVESDAFLDMPLTAQSLYFHLNMSADNDGFVNPKRILRMIGAAHDDLQILIAKRFLIAFDSGVVVVKHWWINNTKRQDRHVDTTYQAELLELIQKDNKAYSKITTQTSLLTGEFDDPVKPLATKRQPTGTSMQFNAVHVQSNSIHVQAKATNKSQGFKKSETLNKKTYARAVEADKKLEAKETQRPPGKGYETAKKVADLLKSKSVNKTTGDGKAA